MIYDYSKLRGRIIEIFKTQTAFAKAIKMSNAAISSRLNNKTYFDQNEIIKVCEVLNIKIEDIQVYFFKFKVQKNWINLCRFNSTENKGG